MTTQTVPVRRVRAAPQPPPPPAATKRTRGVAPAAKTAPPPAPVGTPGKKRRRYTDTDEITLLAGVNPHRLGSAAHTCFELYHTCRTVGAWRTAAPNTGYLATHVAMGIIRITQK